ncbi:MFS transporter [Deinococcus yavapaiensis]|uniref:DHA3 family macrolide efflux protein-like MFS transporter n=1 Tax=Deinococcus yavapaiensis KR-236 TaxID=694435 RepID=A0A318S6R8_9DEIO|nr:MFS transporter [Deinococcus yavapaiensis]PYE50530.1 DHA3 family macrolide efflux protein-like MFS transporter [Deinococcus yavapaiensis KR-236]
MDPPLNPQPSPTALLHPDPGFGWQRRFWAIFSGQACSLIGSALTQFVLMWWITSTTGSAAALATAGMAALLPQALLGPLGGTLADRYSRRALMIGADVVSAACMLVLIALFLTERVELWHVYTMMSVRSAMQAFQEPAAAASTAMLVPASFLPRAAGLNQTLQGIMTIAAAPLGALATSVMPLGFALGIDVVTALLGVVPLLLFRVPQVKPTSAQKTSLWSEFREGVTLVWQHPGLRRLYALLGVIVLAILPSFTLLPLLVKTHFGGGASDVALMEGLSGVGMIVGGAAIAAIAPQRHMPWILPSFAVACLSLALTALAPSDLFWLAVVWWVTSGVAFIMGSAPFTALLQTTIPNHLQGRALSLLAAVMGLAGPIGLALAGPLGEWLGVRWLLVTQGLLGMLASLLGVLSPTLRRLDAAAERPSTERLP